MCASLTPSDGCKAQGNRQRECCTPNNLDFELLPHIQYPAQGRRMPPAVAFEPRDTSTLQKLRSQWVNPNDILSLLLLVGGDVIQQALAQQSGDRFPTPVVFSFGWVAYAFTTLLATVGDDRLMPSPPASSSSIVMSTNYGHARTNTSWILNRFVTGL